ncbi:DUF4412 domain-containing protein [Wenyingzhuangia sp. IMCC45533]
MKTKLLTFLLVSITINTHAQFFKKLKSKITEKIDQTVDGNIDQVFKKKTKNTTSTPATKPESDNNISTDDVDQNQDDGIDDDDEYNYSNALEGYTESHHSVTKTYIFDTQTIMMYEDNQGNQSTFSILQNVKDSYYGITVPNGERETVMIQDGDTSVNLLNTGERKIQIPSQVSLPEGNTFSNTYHDLKKFKQFKKTGKTKKILKYNAYQYTVQDQKGFYEFWTTKDIKLKNFYTSKNSFLEGYLLEVNYKSNQGENFTSRVIEIKPIDISYNAAEYKNFLDR